MYHIMSKTIGNTIGVRIEEELTVSDYEKFTGFVEREIERYGSVNLMIELSDFEGIEAGALWEDFKFDIKHRNDFDRVAIIGSKDWMEWMTKMTSWFYDAEVKFFEPEESDKAWLWVRERTLETVAQATP